MSDRWRTWAFRLLLVAAIVGLLMLFRWLVFPLFLDPKLIPRKLTLRMVFAAVTSFLIVVLLSPGMIRYLIRRKLGDRPEFDHAALNELTRHKSATPTMGVVLIVPAIMVATFVFGDIASMYVRMSFVVMVWLGLLGGVDDWLKLRCSTGEGTRDGLKMYQKILFQIALAVLLAFFIHHHGSLSYFWEEGAVWENRGSSQVGSAMQYMFFPFDAGPVVLPVLAFVIVTVLVMVGSSNAVNLTDGMDGLAGGCMVIVTGVFLMLTWVTGVEEWAFLFHLPFVPASAELTVLCAAMVGSCLGFLRYNCLPAQMFMGDTGSLPLGGLIGYIAIVTRQELMLLIAGGVFVMEAASVIFQILYFKWTGGRRLFRCAPIHHHFHLLGWAESKVVVRFWLMGVVCAAIALATLKLR